MATAFAELAWRLGSTRVRSPCGPRPSFAMICSYQHLEAPSGPTMSRRPSMRCSLIRRRWAGRRGGLSRRRGRGVPPASSLRSDRPLCAVFEALLHCGAALLSPLRVAGRRRHACGAWRVEEASARRIHMSSEAYCFVRIRLGGVRRDVFTFRLGHGSRGDAWSPKTRNSSRFAAPHFCSRCPKRPGGNICKLPKRRMRSRSRTKFVDCIFVVFPGGWRNTENAGSWMSCSKPQRSAMFHPIGGSRSGTGFGVRWLTIQEQHRGSSLGASQANLGHCHDAVAMTSFPTARYSAFLAVVWPSPAAEFGGPAWPPTVTHGRTWCPCSWMLRHRPRALCPRPNASRKSPPPRHPWTQCRRVRWRCRERTLTLTAVSPATKHTSPVRCRFPSHANQVLAFPHSTVGLGSGHRTEQSTCRARWHADRRLR